MLIHNTSITMEREKKQLIFKDMNREIGLNASEDKSWETLLMSGDSTNRPQNV